MYFVVRMPLNRDGEGPEMDEDKVVEVIYEVWDDAFQHVSSYSTEEEASHHCNILNQFALFI